MSDSRTLTSKDLADTAPTFVTFDSLPLGARFKYPGLNGVFVKLENGGSGIVAEWDNPQLNWPGQGVYSFADCEVGRKTGMVEWLDRPAPETPPDLDAGKTKLAITMLERFRDGRLMTAQDTHESLLGPRDQLLQEADWFDHAAKVLKRSLPLQQETGALPSIEVFLANLPPGAEERVANAIITSSRLEKLSNQALVDIALDGCFEESPTATLVLHEMCSRLHPGWENEIPEKDANPQNGS